MLLKHELTLRIVPNFDIEDPSIPFLHTIIFSAPALHQLWRASLLSCTTKCHSIVHAKGCV